MLPTDRTCRKETRILYENISDSSSAGADRQFLRLPQICLVHFHRIRCGGGAYRRRAARPFPSRAHRGHRPAMHTLPPLRLPALRLSGLPGPQDRLHQTHERGSQTKRRGSFRCQAGNLDLRFYSLCTPDVPCDIPPHERKWHGRALRHRASHLRCRPDARSNR